MSQLPSEVLHEIDSDPRWAEEGISVREEISQAIDRSTATVSRILSGQAGMSIDQAAALSRRFCQLGDDRLARCFVNGEYAVYRRIPATANGTHHDEMNDLVKYAGAYAQAMDAGSGTQAIEAWHRLQHVMARMLLEAERQA